MVNPFDMSQRDLAAFVSSFQRQLFFDYDEKRWDSDTEVNGADFVQWAIEAAELLDLIPDNVVDNGEAA